MLETKEQRQARLQEYTPEYMELKAYRELSPPLPLDGETYTAKGGAGNKILKQVKNEKGIYYERENPQHDWTVMDVTKVLERMLDSIGGINDKEENHKKWYEFWK